MTCHDSLLRYLQTRSTDPTQQRTDSLQKTLTSKSTTHSSIGTSRSFRQAPNENDTLEVNQMLIGTDTVEWQADTVDSGLIMDKEESSKKPSSGLLYERSAPSFWMSYIFNPMRLGLQYEAAYKFTEPDKIRRNRLSFRLEYSKSLSDLFSLHVDAKLLTFLESDHRARKATFWINDDSTEVDLSLGTLAREAYLQASFHNTSIKAGIQTLVWGESDFAVVTNEISPLDYREPLNLNIDELRFGQLMLTVDQYSSFGQWSGFFIPYPRFNRHPKEGTEYYYDPFNGSVEYQMETQDQNLSEYGIRWRKTFGKSDISFMAARLTNNEYALRMVTPSLIAQSELRYSMSGLTFNHAVSNFLFKGEVAMKFPKAYNDASFQIVKKNALDASLGVDYSLSNTFTLSVEGVNYHTIDWNDEIQGVPKDNYLALLILSKQLMNNDLSVNCVTMYNGPHTNFFNLLTTSYNWTDHITMNLVMLIPVTDDINSGLYIYRDEKQVSFNILYQF